MTIDNPSDTPNTEAAVFTHTRMRDGVIVGEQDVVDADFARGLERELADARREAEHARACAADLRMALNAANAALRDILNPEGVQGSEWHSKHAAAIERARK